MVYFSQNAPDKSDRKFISRSMKAPMLEKEEELALGRAWRDENDKTALDKLVSSHVRLSVKIASRFKGYGLPITDLIQEGNLGLLDAAKKFDPEKGARFSTYASWWVLASIQDYVLRNSSIVRIGTTQAQKSLFFKLRKLRNLISKNLVGQMSTEDREAIATTLNVPIDAVERMEAHFSGPDKSLNASVGHLNGENNQVQDFLEDNRPNPEIVVGDILDSERRTQWIATAMHSLNDREQEIIRQRFLVGEKKTLAEIAVKFGVTKERIRQIESRALQTLKSALEKTPRASADRIDDLVNA